MFIAIEGLDKTGKETQSKKLAELLQSAGRAVLYVDYPRYGEFFGKMIGQYLRSEFGHIKDLPPRLTMLPYACDRMREVPAIAAHIGCGRDRDVVANRYAYSNAFGIARLPREKWDAEIEWLEELEFGQFGLPRPDVNILLHLPASVSYGLRNRAMKGYQNGRADAHESDIKLLRDVEELYLHLAERDPAHWRVIDEMSAEIGPSGGQGGAGDDAGDGGDVFDIGGKNRRRLDINGVFALVEKEVGRVLSAQRQRDST
jgi:dTMP kinase